MTDENFTTDELIKTQGFVLKLLISVLDKKIPGLSETLHNAVATLSNPEGANADPRHVTAIQSILPRRR
jgi:hypothetical protein